MENILNQQANRQKSEGNIKTFETIKNDIKFETIQPEKITNEKVLKNDIYYNPILQKYNNINLESKSIQKDKEAMMDKIIKSRDNQLKNEQVYNIINLEDRFKGFETSRNYISPETINKQSKKRFFRGIYKNLQFIQNNENLQFSRNHKRFSYFHKEKDYDIITTKYKHFNDEKNYIDKEINKINTARVFYKNNDYNPIKGAFYNDEKEEEFQKKRYETQLTWGQKKLKNLPKCAKGKSNVYNLITTNIVDPTEMNRLLEEERHKKQRYELRYKLEKYYKDKCVSKLSLDEIRNKNKVSFQRYKVEDQRLYNILNLKEKPYKEHAKHSIGHQTIWETILSGGNDNNTFDKKEIYKDPYDCSETERTFYEYQVRRNNTLSSLKEIKEDKLFNNIKKFNNKYRLRKCITNKKPIDEIHKLRKFSIDKSQFFSKNN